MKYYMIKKDGQFFDATHYGKSEAIKNVERHKYWDNKYMHEEHEYEIVEFTMKKEERRPL